jgi:murein L,D-transpeptidase YafK
MILVALGSATAGRAEPLVDRIVVDKVEHRLSLYRAGTLVKVYSVALGRGGLAPKQQAGDGLVPEGVYRISERKADSRFYRALRISYPSPNERAEARRRGVDPGGDVMIHGLRNGLGWFGGLHRQMDWTAGCIALTDAEMDELWDAVPVGTTVEIRHAATTGTARQPPL